MRTFLGMTLKMCYISEAKIKNAVTINRVIQDHRIQIEVEGIPHGVISGEILIRSVVITEDLIIADDQIIKEIEKECEIRNQFRL